MAEAGLLQDGDSPCVHICLMDYEQGLCIGCHRTLDEITRLCAGGAAGASFGASLARTENGRATASVRSSFLMWASGESGLGG